MNTTTDNNWFSMIEIDNAPAAPAAPPAKVEEVPVPAPAPAPVEAAPEPAPVALPADLAYAFAPPPAPMVTSHGATMSPRMARWQRWCDHHKLGLRDWSTDTQVKELLPRLTALREQLAAQGAQLAPGQAKEWARDLYADLASTMRRVPENRSSVSAPAAAKASTDPAKARGVVAVEKADESTGAITLWQLSDDASLDSLRAQWAAQGLDEALLPSYPSETVALTRAATSLRAQHILVRKDPRGGWGVVRESASAATGLSYTTLARVHAAEGEVRVVADEADAALAQDLEARVRAAYAQARAALSTVDVSTWLVGLANKLGALSMVPRGGTYFIPRGAAIETWHKAKLALESCTSHMVYEIPAMRSAEAVRAIIDAVGREAHALVEGVESEMATGEGIGLRAAKNRVGEIDALKKKLRGYEELVGQKLESTEAKLTALRAKLEAVQTRTSQLEIY